MQGDSRQSSSCSASGERSAPAVAHAWQSCGHGAAVGPVADRLPEQPAERRPAAHAAASSADTQRCRGMPLRASGS